MKLGKKKRNKKWADRISFVRVVGGWVGGGGNEGGGVGWGFLFFLFLFSLVLFFLNFFFWKRVIARLRAGASCVGRFDDVDEWLPHI